MRPTESIWKVCLIGAMVLLLLAAVGVHGVHGGDCDEACTGYEQDGCAENPGVCVSGERNCGSTTGHAKKELGRGYAFCEEAQAGANCPHSAVECAEVQWYEKIEKGVCVDPIENCWTTKYADGCE